ncbi:MAG: hypothetical protein M3Q64_00220 [bacterium]|nr:hypothetical protein [bacterium]
MKQILQKITIFIALVIFVSSISIVPVNASPIVVQNTLASEQATGDVLTVSTVSPSTRVAVITTQNCVFETQALGHNGLNLYQSPECFDLQLGVVPQYKSLSVIEARSENTVVVNRQSETFSSDNYRAVPEQVSAMLGLLPSSVYLESTIEGDEYAVHVIAYQMESNNDKNSEIVLSQIQVYRC